MFDRWVRAREMLATTVLPLMMCVATVTSFYHPAARDAAASEAFFDAARGGNLFAVERALNAGTLIDGRERGSGLTALMYAARFGRDDVARRLVERGADLRMVARGSGSALACAAAAGQPRLVRLLLESGADPNLCDPTGHSPLMHAASEGTTDSVELLLGAGASVNAADRFGNTALTDAAGQGHLDALRLLVNAGADVGARDEAGRDAAAVADEMNEPAAAQWLRARRFERGAKLR